MLSEQPASSARCCCEIPAAVLRLRTLTTAAGVSLGVDMSSTPRSIDEIPQSDGNFRSYADMLLWWAPGLDRDLSEGLRRAVQEQDLAAAGEMVLEAGLMRRAGRYLVGPERAVYAAVRQLCAPDFWPQGVSVCATCALVFRHSYRPDRSRCDGCHARPRRRRPIVDVDRHGAAITDPAQGGVLFRLNVCEHCGQRFESPRPRRFCPSPGSSCQKRHSRGLPPPADSISAAIAAAEEAEQQFRRANPWDELSAEEQREWKAYADAVAESAAASAAAAEAALPQFWRDLLARAGPLLEQLAATGSLVDPEADER